MATVNDLREIVLSLPATSEGTHFRLPSFQVNGKNFIGIQPDGRVTMSMDPPYIANLVAQDPAVFAEIRRSDKPIGVSVDLARVDRQQLRELAERAWRSKAPKKLLNNPDVGATTFREHR